MSELMSKLQAGGKVMLMTHNLRIVCYKQTAEHRVKVPDIPQEGDVQFHYEKRFTSIPYHYELVNFWLAKGSHWDDLSEYERSVVKAAGISKFIHVEHAIIEEIT